MTIKFLQAHQGDSILISFKDHEDIDRNILIDGGIDKTYWNTDSNQAGQLYTEIEEIKAINQKIDLLILTHIDDDHIGGLLSWLSRDEDANKYISDVWFNSGKLVAEYLKLPENESMKLELQNFKDSNTSAQQGIDFEDYLLTNNIWSRKVVSCGQEFDILGLKFQILTPNINKLERLREYFFEKTSDNSYTAGGNTDWKLNIKDIIDQEAQKGFRMNYDSAAPNGSSITFIMTHNKNKYLFLSDSHASSVVKALKALGYSNKNQLEVEFMKVSHHGSKYNTSLGLLDLIKTNDYVFCTDSTENGHPNKATLARIVKKNDKARFHFNYEYVYENVFSCKDFNNYEYLESYFAKKYPFKVKAI